MAEEVPLVLVVNKISDKVMFAGADKEFVDILFSFLTMPLGTLARLVQEESHRDPVQVGSLNTLYNSAVNFEEVYLWSDTCKEMLMRPRNSSENYCRNLKLNIDDTAPTTYFLCQNFHDCEKNMLSTFPNKKCKCGVIMNHLVPFQSKEYQGFLRSSGTTFIISEHMNVFPNTVYEDLQSLKNFFQTFLERYTERNDVSHLFSFEIITMNINKTQMLDLLKCCLLSKTSLTDFFYVNKPFVDESIFCIPCFEGYSAFRIKVKMVVRKSNRKILYVEGEEDFADFILSILTLPLGAVVRLLRSHSSMGSVDHLYKSINIIIEDNFFLSSEEKRMLLDPYVAQHFQSRICKHMFPINEHESVYYCEHQSSTDVTESIPQMQLRLAEDGEVRNCENYRKMKLVEPKSPSEGFFKVHANLPATFLATDDLVLERAYMLSGYRLANRLRIPLWDITEKNVFIGTQEALGILKASLTSRSALTNGLSNLLANIYVGNGFVDPVWAYY